jgi:hypothetical protein
VVVTSETTGCVPFHVMVLAYWITASSESSKAPFQCCSRIPQHRSIGLYLTRIRRILRQADREVKALGKLHQTVHELGASAVALRAVIQVDDQGPDERKALFDHLPPVD